MPGCEMAIAPAHRCRPVSDVVHRPAAGVVLQRRARALRGFLHRDGGAGARAEGELNARQGQLFDER